MTEGSLTFIRPQSFCLMKKMHFIPLIFLKTLWCDGVWLIHFGSCSSHGGENHHDKWIFYGFDEWSLPCNYQAIVSMKDAGKWNFSLQITSHPVWQEKWISIFNILLWIKAHEGRAPFWRLWRVGWIWKSACLNEVVMKFWREKHVQAMLRNQILKESWF